MEAGQQTTAPTAEAKAPIPNKARGRAPRPDLTKRRRRERHAGTLNRMHSFKLDCFDEKQLDLENYVYRWINDENGRLRAATRTDDYDFVQTHEIEGFDPDETDSESEERVRMNVGTDKVGNPIYAYLLRKPRAFVEADYGEIVSAREDMMEGRVSRAEGGADVLTDELADAGELPEHAYVPSGNKIGHAGGRRRGPLQPKRK